MAIRGRGRNKLPFHLHHPHSLACIALPMHKDRQLYIKKAVPGM